MKLKSIFVTITYLLLIALWVYAALSKLVDVEFFKFQLRQSPLFKNISYLVAYGIPLIELAIAALLVFERTKRTGLKLSLALLLTFTVYLGGILSFSKEVPCTCGGLISKMSWGQHIVFNLTLSVLAYLALLFTKPGQTGKIKFEAHPTA